MTLRKRAAAIGDTPPRPFGREICNQMPNPSISAPPPRSYRLRRHFPRHCDVTTRVLHPYKPRFLRKEGTAGSPAAAPSSRHFTVRYRNCVLSGLFPRAYALSIQTHFRDSPPPRRSAHPHLLRRPHPCGPGLASRQKNGFSDTGIPGIRKYYQLAFFTPGIRPFEAISRNWIRLMPNRRM